MSNNTIENSWEGTVRILMIEDNQDDVHLTERELKKESFNYTLKVIDKEEELKAVDLSSFDIVLCDYNMTNFNGLTAVRYIRENSDIPVLIVSGSISEGMSFELLKEGATDFVSKNFLQKVAFRMKQIVSNQNLKTQSTANNRKLEESSHLFNTLFDGLDNPVFLKDADRKYVRVNASFCNLYARNKIEIIGKTDEEIGWNSYRKQTLEEDKYVLSTGKVSNYQMSYIDDNGNKIWLDVSKNPIYIDGQITGILGQAKDITKKEELVASLERSQSMLRQTEVLTRSGSFEYNAELDLVNCSDNLMKFLGLKSSHISLSRLVRFVKKEDRELFLCGIYQSIESKQEYRMHHKYELSEEMKGSFEIFIRPDFRDELGNIFYGAIITKKEKAINVPSLNHQEESRKEIRVNFKN